MLTHVPLDIQRKFTFSADELEDAYDGTSTDNSE
jgi:hypothetical protein